MDEDTIFFETDSSGGYLGSLIISRQHLKDAPKLLAKLEAVIELELELALLGAEKAKSEVLKANAKNNAVRPIK